MDSTGLNSPLRQILEQGFTDLSREAEECAQAQAAEAYERGRRETGDRLNQAVRRMRQAAGVEELKGALVDSASEFAEGVALFTLEGDAVRGDSIRGASPEAAVQFGELAVSLAQAPALAGAVTSRDPVVAVTTAAEVSPEMAELLSHKADGRAYIFPVSLPERVAALLYSWGKVEAPALELLAQAAAAVWSGYREPEPAALVTIAPAAGSASAWESLTADDQRIHLRAQRFARVRVAEMRMRYAAEVLAGRAGRDLYAALRDPIDAAREAFPTEYFTKCASMVDYLHLEMVRTLANDDPILLGEDYPGVLA